jgi:NAD(P)H-flavin reductase
MANPNYGRALWNGQEDSESSQEIIERQYTPVSHPDMKGSVDLAVKIYRPETVRLPNGKELHFRNGGKVSKSLDSFMPGDSFEIAGPFGLTEYKGRGVFSFPGSKKAGIKTEFAEVGMLAGGAGITPFMQMIQKALGDPEDKTVFSLIYANKTEADILCKDILDDMAVNSNGRFRVLYTLDFPTKDWAGRGTSGNHRHGYISEEMISGFLPKPESEPMVLMCGPPPMIENACKKNLKSLGYNMKLATGV